MLMQRGELRRRRCEALLGRKLAAEGRSKGNVVVGTVMQLRTRAGAARRGRAADSHGGRRPRGHARDAAQLVQPRRRAVGPRDSHGLFDHGRRADVRARCSCSPSGRERASTERAARNAPGAAGAGKTCVSKIAYRSPRCPTCNKSSPKPNGAWPARGRGRWCDIQTQMLARVMVEGEDGNAIKTLAQ